MRWRFESAGQKQATLAAIDAFWSAFAQSSQELSDTFRGAGSFDVVAFMKDNLTPVHADMMWEFGPALAGDGHRLIVTPEHRYELTELARTMVERAPKLDRWEFYVHRLTESFDQTAQTVANRTGGDITAGTFELAWGVGGLIDVSYWSESKTRDHDVFLSLEALLGERALNTWIGDISSEKPKRFGSKGAPLQTLPDAFSRMQSERFAALADQPYVAWLTDESEVHLVSLQPTEATDYAGQDDRVTAITPDVTFSNATLTSDRFRSERFSRHGEVFAYLKMDGS